MFLDEVFKPTVSPHSRLVFVCTPSINVDSMGNDIVCPPQRFPFTV